MGSRRHTAGFQRILWGHSGDDLGRRPWAARCHSHYVSLPSLVPWGKACRLSGDVEPESSWFSHHQGNIEFVETEEGHLSVAEDRLVDHVAELTATSRELVLRCLLARTVASGGREVIQKGHTAAEASYARDACAKVLQRQAMWGGPVSRSSWRRQGQRQPEAAWPLPRQCTSGSLSGW